MISNQEEDEFVAVRVQDPRMQNEGSWNSYVDYKIFLHTNSKAFTAKTSCVRRRYSEFAWLKKKLQKNAGLVPVPDLPGKSFFSFSNEDFLERRRKGLQAFLDNVVNMTVCLSDSQLHLFLQTQLPVGHIQDCVQGHTPYSVTDAILTYASSNRGFAQAQEEDSIKEPSLTVSYESMESPAPHIPKEIFSPDLLTRADPDPLDDLLELRDKDTSEFQHKDKSSIRVLQKNNHLEAVVEDRGPADVTFFVGDRQDVPESLGLSEQSQQRSCQIQTPVEVHSPRGTGCVPDSMFEECSENEASVIILESEEKTDPNLDVEEKADQVESPAEINIEKVDCEGDKCAAVLDFKDCEKQGTESDVGSQEEVLGEVCSEKQVLENEVNGLEGHVEEVSCPQASRSSDDEKSDESETPLESQIHEETQSVPEVEPDKQMDQQDRTNSDEESRSSSNESIVKVSDEESVCDEAEAANDYMKTPPEDDARWAEVDDSSRNILDLHMNGCSVERDDDLQYITDLSKSLDLNSSVTGGEPTEHSDFSIIETPVLADSKGTELEDSQEAELR